jgi:hypothetical protein
MRSQKHCTAPVRSPPKLLADFAGDSNEQQHHAEQQVVLKTMKPAGSCGSLRCPVDARSDAIS